MATNTRSGGPDLRKGDDLAHQNRAAVTLTEAFTSYCLVRELEPPPELRILNEGLWPPPLRGADDEPEPERVAPHDLIDPYALGEMRERLLTGEEQRGRGAWYTPRWLAREIVERTVTSVGVVADPACGGGVFLLSAADRLHELGAPPVEIVGSLLWGTDIDAMSVAIAEAALWLWSADHGAPTVAGERLVVGDALTEIELPPCAAVVGNPPFLGQLRRSTVVDDHTRALLKARFDGTVAPYTDMAWLFLLAATQALDPGGRATLVQPQSLLAARDAAPVRERIDQLADLESCWIDDGDTFAASVEVCAPTLVRHSVLGSSERHGARDRQPRTDLVQPERESHASRWIEPLLAHLGVPVVAIDETGVCVGDRADVIAGFRDEYYGLVSAVREGGEGPALVTSGAIDPLRRRDVQITFARQRWTDPRIDLAAVDGRGRRWVEAQLRPGLLLANQTKVLEAVVDEAGELVIGVPGIAVIPQDADDLWLLATALHAPCISAWMMARTAGTGMSAAVCRPTARLVGEIPLPADPVLWERAATLARTISEGADCWSDFAATADSAYGMDDQNLRAWWLGRLPRR